MKNVDVKVTNNQLVITVDLSKSFGLSKTGKTTIIASTEGNHVITMHDGKPITLGLNIYTK